MDALWQADLKPLACTVRRGARARDAGRNVSGLYRRADRPWRSQERAADAGARRTCPLRSAAPSLRHKRRWDAWPLEAALRASAETGRGAMPSCRTGEAASHAGGEDDAYDLPICEAVMNLPVG
jgi:hypothetical protein